MLSCLRRVCQGSTNVSFQRSVLCVQERVQNASCVFPENDAKKTLVSKLHIYHHCSENLMRFWHLLIDRLCLVKNLKTWWKLSENLVNFQILVKIWCISKNLVNTGLFPKPDGNLVNLQNLVKSWWMPKPGENLVNSPSFHQTNERSILCTEGFW